MDRRQLIVTASLCLLAPGLRANAAPPEISRAWAQARLVGSGRLRFIGVPVYDARLWAPGPLSTDAWAAQEFALELQYARALGGQAIAERSLEEMRRQGSLAGANADRWLATLKATFPDVQKGDRLTGIYRPPAPTGFFLNAEPRGEWIDSALGRQFFGIWLAPQTSQPTLREALFGGRS